jgi:hypothetical protein
MGWVSCLFGISRWESALENVSQLMSEKAYIAIESVRKEMLLHKSQIGVISVSHMTLLFLR